jgi:hypothetical protein
VRARTRRRKRKSVGGRSGVKRRQMAP